MENIRKVGFCPHCGNTSPQQLIHAQYTSDTGWIIAKGGEKGWIIEDNEEVDLTVVYFVAICETCGHILVYQSVEDIPDEEFFTFSDLVYPKSSRLYEEIPKTVSKIYSEASRIKKLAPNAFAVQIRRALEALCEDRGAQKDTLQKMLKELSAKGEIPSALVEATDLLRLLGNIGAHVSEDSVKPWQVEAIDEFFRAIIEYVYIAPNKIKDFRERMKIFQSRTDK